MPKIAKKASENPNKVKRIRTGPPKKWTDEECLSVLHYILDQKNCGKPFEKPTAETFYIKMIERLQLEAKWQQIKAKMNNLRLKYLDVKKWLEGTGQGVDSGTIEGYKNSKCQYFDLLHDIFSDKASITIPYVYQSSVEKSDKTYPNDANEINAGSNVADDDNFYGGVDINLNNEIDSNIGGGEGDDLIFIDSNSNNNCDDNDEDLIGNNLNGENNGEDNEVGLIRINLSSDNSGVNDENGIEMDSTGMEVVSVIDIDKYLNEIESAYSQQSASSLQSPQTSSKRRKTNAPPVRRDFVPSDEELAFNIFAADPPGCRSDDECSDSRAARFKKQLSERPSGKQPHKRQIPSNAAAFISDANLKRAETLHEKNYIDMSRLDFDKILYKQQLLANKVEVAFKNQQLILQDRELKAKIDLRKKKFDYKVKQFDLQKSESENAFKLKVLELEKAERMEKLKMELEYKLQLDIAKLKQ